MLNIYCSLGLLILLAFPFLFPEKSQERCGFFFLFVLVGFLKKLLNYISYIQGNFGVEVNIVEKIHSLGSAGITKMQVNLLPES